MNAQLTVGLCLALILCVCLWVILTVLIYDDVKGSNNQDLTPIYVLLIYTGVVVGGYSALLGLAGAFG